MPPAENATTGGRTPYTYTNTTTPWNRWIIIPLWLTQIAYSFVVFDKVGNGQKYALPMTRFPDRRDKIWCGSRMSVQIVTCTGFAAFTILPQIAVYLHNALHPRAALIAACISTSLCLPITCRAPFFISLRRWNTEDVELFIAVFVT